MNLADRFRENLTLAHEKAQPYVDAAHERADAAYASIHDRFAGKQGDLMHTDSASDVTVQNQQFRGHPDLDKLHLFRTRRLLIVVFTLLTLGVRACIQKPGTQKTRKIALLATEEHGSAPLIWSPLLNRGTRSVSPFGPPGICAVLRVVYLELLSRS